MSVAFVDVCSFEEVGTTFKLCRLALRGKAHHHPALPEVPGSPSDGVELNAEVQYHLLKRVLSIKKLMHT